MGLHQFHFNFEGRNIWTTPPWSLLCFYQCSANIWKLRGAVSGFWGGMLSHSYLKKDSQHSWVFSEVFLFHSAPNAGLDCRQTGLFYFKAVAGVGLASWLFYNSTDGVFPDVALMYLYTIGNTQIHWLTVALPSSVTGLFCLSDLRTVFCFVSVH